MTLDILVVDDHSGYVRGKYGWAGQFKDSANFDVEAIGNRAVQLVKDKPFDLVVLDYNLATEMNGFQVAQRIREIRPDTRMIGCSTDWKQSEAEQVGLEAYFPDVDGAERYIAKMIKGDNTQ